MRRFILLILSVPLLILSGSFQPAEKYRVAVLKYSGGGDWYSNPTSLPNLVAFCNKNLQTQIETETDVVEPGSSDIFNYPFIHMTGHGNVVFNANEADNLRNYLYAGGFLHIDDNYGMDAYIRPELSKLFPGQELIELPPSHPIFHQTYEFKTGLPKIHEHDDKPAQAFAIYHEGRMIVLYTYQCDLGDGWENPQVHGDSKEKHETALKMGANIIEFVFMKGALTIQE